MVNSHIRPGDEPSGGSPDDTDAAFRSLYAEHGPARLRALRRALAVHDAVA
jgi:hypothetical protein